MKTVPTIQKYMTVHPHTVNADMPLSVAHKLMHEHHIRHLPVLRAGNIVGLISDRDISFVSAITGVNLQETAISDAMTEKPYITHPNAQLDEVAMQMAEHKYGSAVVIDNNKVVGIFTMVDGMRSLAELLRTRLA